MDNDPAKDGEENGIVVVLHVTLFRRIFSISEAIDMRSVAHFTLKQCSLCHKNVDPLSVPQQSIYCMKACRQCTNSGEEWRKRQARRVSFCVPIASQAREHRRALDVDNPSR